ncbi:MAG: hypothetical protein R3D45_01995 [Rhizobiaceae bacterium]
MRGIMTSVIVTMGSVAAALAAAMAVTAAAQEKDCLICDREVVLDRRLAACFLDRYEVLQTRQSSAIAVDLTDCPELPAQAGEPGEQDRGVVEALRMPEAPVGEPNVTFMITRAQLACLKQHLEDDNLVLDPAARIALEDCE